MICEVNATRNKGPSESDEFARSADYMICDRHCTVLSAPTERDQILTVN